MSEIFNLKQARKSKARTAEEKKADQNRRLHGRTKAEKQREKIETERASKHLDGHKRDDDKN